MKRFVLQPLLPIRPDETHLSWASRLAAFHIGTGMEEFLQDQNIDLSGWLEGDDHAVSMLCAITGMAPHQVSDNTFTLTRRQVVRFRDETLIGLVRPDDQCWFCPRCLQEDLNEAAKAGFRPECHLHERLLWRLKPAQRCPSHGCQLQMASRNPDEGAIPPSVFRGLRASGECSEGLVMRRAPHEQYLSDRLMRRQTGSWLDQHSLNLLFHAAQALGTALTFGVDLTFEDLGDRQKDAAIRAGWHFLARGPQGVNRALSILDRREPSVKIPPKVRRRRVFGSLLYESEFSAGHQFLRQCIDEFCAKQATEQAA